MWHRNKKPGDVHAGKWNGLGGKLEAGKSLEMCVRREVLEESGLEIHDPYLHGLLAFPNFKGQDWFVFVFTATAFEGELIDSPEGRLEWIADEEISKLPLWPSDHIFLPWLDGQRFFSARFQYEGEVMLGPKWRFIRLAHSRNDRDLYLHPLKAAGSARPPAGTARSRPGSGSTARRSAHARAGKE